MRRSWEHSSSTKCRFCPARRRRRRRFSTPGGHFPRRALVVVVVVVRRGRCRCYGDGRHGDDAGPHASSSSSWWWLAGLLLVGGRKSGYVESGAKYPSKSESGDVCVVPS